MQKEKLVPEIRFKGFEEKWETSLLEEFGKCVSGYGFPISEQGNKEGIPFYKVSDMNLNENYLIMNKANNYVSKNIALNKNWKIINMLPAIIFAKVGAAVLLNRKRIANSPFLIDNNMMAYLSKKTVDASYLYYIFYKINLTDLIQCSALPSINAYDILNFQAQVTKNINEQQKIGQFFSNLDSLIRSQELKLKKLNEVKQSFLSKMFASKNQKFPQIRFKGFEDEWNLDKVCNLFKITRGEVLSQNQISEFQNEIYTYPVYSSQTLRNGLMGYYKEYLFENCITWTTDGANAGTVKFRNEKFYCTNVCGVLEQGILKPNSCVAELLNIVAPNYVTRAGNPKLMNSTMGEIMINYPNSTIESSKISTLFMSIDSLISSQELKLEKLNNIKQALLEKMFC
ncbi:restriction endonuclease subunit S [Mycoplasma sp. 31_09]|uniref:restriction endonuclease subunit S n=1 Tax=Mycoplasma sp. 31_09 TaxID=3401663 RepID=UPI003AB036AF